MAASTVWLGVADKPKAAAITATLTILLCIFVFLARFKRFKGFGIEGELWEQEMEQAAELRRGLTELAEQVGASVSWQMGIGNRWDSGTFNEKLAAIERTSGILERIGVSPLRIEELKRPWHKCVMVDLARPIADRLRAKINENMEHVDAGIRAEKKERMAERPGTEEMAPTEAALVERYHAMGRSLSQSDEVIWRDDYENVPHLLRQSIDQSPWLSPDDRQVIYHECADEFRDIDRYARERIVRRPEVLDR